MKAVLCKSYGPPEDLAIEEIRNPEPEADDVLIDVHAAGVNFTDTLIIENNYQVRPGLPFVPGSEAAGTVRSVGKKVTGIRSGDRVIGFRPWGAFAERMAVPRCNVFPMPENMDFIHAAAFPTAYGTAYHSLKRRAALKPGETLLVLGATGGVGMAAVALGKLMGARVIAAGGSDEKLEILSRFKVDHVLNYSLTPIKETVKALTGGNGADVVYDPVGGDIFDQAIRCVSWNGRYLVVGFAEGRIPMVPANIVLLKGFQVVGVHWGVSRLREPEMNQKDFAELLQWLGEGKICPVIAAVFPMEAVSAALRAIIDRKVTGKAVLSVKPNYE
jgi:NADPH2:quinone reductase